MVQNFTYPDESKVAEIMFPKDKVMQALYERVVAELGTLEFRKSLPADAYFSNLCEAIIGQQLSGKAADTIIGRVREKLTGKEFTPETVLARGTEEFRAAGCSFAKISYIKNLAEAWQSGQIEHTKFAELDNETIIAELTKVKGIGRWTAEMFLMFTLGRPDVFSAGDLGLKNGMMRAYKMRKWPHKQRLELLTKKWSPHRTLASRVLWRSLELKTSEA